MSRKITPETAAAEWIHIKTEMKEAEKRLALLKEVLEPYLSELEEKSQEFHGWKFSLVEFEKESFSLSKAKEKIDGRILSPYISKSDVVQIRTSWQGGESESR